VTVIVLAAVFLLFTLFDRVISVWTDWLWFGEVRYKSIFTGVLSTRLTLFVLFGVGMGVFVALNLYLAYRLRPLLRPHSLEQQTLDRYRLLITPRIGTWITAFALLVALFAGLSARGAGSSGCCSPTRSRSASRTRSSASMSGSTSSTTPSGGTSWVPPSPQRSSRCSAPWRCTTSSAACDCRAPASG